MKKVITGGLLAAALLAGGTGWCAERKSVGAAVFVSGEVQLRRPGSAGFPKLQAGERLYLGDILETGPGARASVVLLYGSEIRLNENTILELIAGKKKGDAAKLARGQVWTRMLHKRGGLDIRTVTAICAVRGTEADIEQLEALTVKVYEGHVDVENEAGLVTLKAGEMTSVAGASAAPVKAARMKPAEFGKWQEGVTSRDIMSVLEQLRAAPGGDKKLRFNVGEMGKSDKDVRIKLKKKDGAE